MREPWTVFVCAELGGMIGCEPVQAWDEESAKDASIAGEFYPRESLFAIREVHIGDAEKPKKGNKR